MYTERYLAAAMRGIPDGQRPDVEAELRSSITDAVEDRVAAGEERAAAEKAVLEGLGNPTRLAAGITGRPLYLIGPDLFLEYRQLLILLISIVVPIVAVVQAAVQLGMDASYVDAVIRGIGGGLTVGVHIFFWVTIVFALMERFDSTRDARTELKQALGSWTVESLPELPARRITVGETAGEVVTAVLSIVGLFFLRDFAPVSDASGQPVPVLAPGLWTFWMPWIIAVLAILAGFAIVKFVVGRWTMPLAAAHAVLQAAFAIPVIFLALSGSLINPTFAEVIGWPPLADGNGPAMLAIAAGVLLVSGWEVVDGFRRARASSTAQPAGLEA
jgi:hypothetical protein